MNTHLPILGVQDLVTQFEFRSGGRINAVNHVSFSLQTGETLGIVGESGSGKSTIARTILRLVPATSGHIQFHGQDILKIPEKQFRPLRQKIQMVLQDPESSLNPRMTVFDAVSEGARNFKLFPNKQELERHIRKLFDQLELPQAGLYRYPHEFSGGQRQRIGIARALIMNPELLIGDEPVSSLDLSVQAQILKLFKEVQATFHLTLIFITHNLAVAKNISDQIIVMYLGKVMESAQASSLFSKPRHPYTQALIQSVLPHRVDKIQKRTFSVLKGEIPSPVNPPSGCVFRTRCPIAQEICTHTTPQLKENAPGHLSACHFPAP